MSKQTTLVRHEMQMPRRDQTPATRFHEMAHQPQLRVLYGYLYLYLYLCASMVI